MNSLQAAILGVIQGLTEFLPVSSSGHLILVSQLMGLPAPGLAFSIMVHLGTALATVIMLWREIVWLLQGMFAGGKSKARERGRAWTIIGFLAVASVPGALLGVLGGDFIDRVFSSAGIASLGLIATGFILMASRAGGSRESAREMRRRQSESRRPAGAGRREQASDPGILGTVTLGRSITIGIAQAIAVLPGVSRSGSTITAGLISGLSRDDAARFSFLMSVPATVGAAFLEYLKLSAAGSPIVTAQGALGAVVALVAGVFALGVVFRVVRRGELSRFAYYCWIAGAASLVWLLFRG